MCWPSRPNRWRPVRAFCERERCPFAVVGVATGRAGTVVYEGDGGGERRTRPHAHGRAAGQTAQDAPRRPDRGARIPAAGPDRRHLQQAVIDVLSHPTVASKRFLVTIGDRTVGGLTPPRPDGRPLAGAGGRLRRHAGRLHRLCRRGHEHGRAHAAGRAGRAGLGRMAVAEAITNLLAAPIELPASSCQPTGWPPAASPARTPTCTPRSGPWAWSCARRWASGHPGGQGQPVHAHAVAGRGRDER
jgi:phosphoribosylformylglycinamidine synthase